MELAYSNRFRMNVRLTAHARTRMIERGVSEKRVLDLIETGTVKHKDEKHLWIFKSYSNRTDNDLCAAAVVGEALVIKTIMTFWQETMT